MTPDAVSQIARVAAVAGNLDALLDRLAASAADMRAILASIPGTNNAKAAAGDE